MTVFALVFLVVASCWVCGVAGSLLASLIGLALYAVGRDHWGWTHRIVDRPVGPWLRSEALSAVTWPVHAWRVLRDEVWRGRATERGEDE